MREPLGRSGDSTSGSVGEGKILLRPPFSISLAAVHRVRKRGTHRALGVDARCLDIQECRRRVGHDRRDLLVEPGVD